MAWVARLTWRDGQHCAHCCPLPSPWAGAVLNEGPASGEQNCVENVWNSEGLAQRLHYRLQSRKAALHESAQAEHQTQQVGTH